MTDITLSHEKRSLLLYCNLLTHEMWQITKVFYAKIPVFKAFCFMRQVTENVLGKQEIDYVPSNLQNLSIKNWIF